MVHSAAGLRLPPGGLVRQPPFRAPHHTTSVVGLVGGGSHQLRPGEVSLANNGVLFMDELGEFGRAALEGLREPLEEGVIRVARAAIRAVMPARFLLVAATNPCPCGGGPPGLVRVRRRRRACATCVGCRGRSPIASTCGSSSTARPSTSSSASKPSEPSAIVRQRVDRAHERRPRPCRQAQRRPRSRRARHVGAAQRRRPRPAARRGRERPPDRSRLPPGPEGGADDRRPRRARRRADLGRRRRVGAADAGVAAARAARADGRPVDRVTADRRADRGAGRARRLRADHGGPAARAARPPRARRGARRRRRARPPASGGGADAHRRRCGRRGRGRRPTGRSTSGPSGAPVPASAP